MFKDSFYQSKILSGFVYPILDSSKIGISIVDNEGTILETNQAFNEMLGCLHSDVLNHKFYEVIFEDDIDAAISNHTQFMAERYYEKREVMIKRKDGKKLFLQLTDIKFNNDSGSIFRITTYTDITEKKYNEIIDSMLRKISHMDESEQTLESIIRNIYMSVKKFMPSINFFVSLYDDETDKISYPYSIDEFGYSGKNLLGAKYCNLITEYILKNGKSVMLRENKLENVLNKCVELPGNSKPASIMGSIIRIKGRPAGVVAIVDFDNIHGFNKCHTNGIDKIAEQISHVLERKRFEEELIQSREKVEASDRIKAAFLTQMSHEVRTPINTIMSFAWLLKEKFGDNRDPEIEEFYSMIELGGKRLMRTIDLLLNMSVLQNETIEVKASKLDLMHSVVNPLVKDAANRAHVKKIGLITENKAPGCDVTGDQSTLAQLFEQLLDNAIKYTDNGHVKVTQYIDDLGRTCVSVSDTGIGISEEYQQKLFTPFSQEEMGYTRKYEGNGLGLALAKRLANLNNADIFVRSEKGKGSVFTVKFNKPISKSDTRFWRN